MIRSAHTAEMTLLLDLGFIVITAAVFAFLGKSVQMPSLVAYILAGILLGPGLGLVKLNDSLELISELGIALLLFLVGLELSLQKIKNLSHIALVLGGGQIILTAAGGFTVAQLMGFGAVSSGFLAVTATFSSTVVVIKLLDQKGTTGTLYGRIAISLFLAQDVAVILLLTILSGIRSEGAIEFFELARGLAGAFGGIIVLFLISWSAAHYVLPKPFAWASRSPDTVFIWALCWCFLMVLIAHKFHLSVEIGAFLAGIAIAQLPIHEDLHRRLHPLMNFFVAIFLVTLGIKMDLRILGDVWLYVLGFTAFVIFIKPLIVFLILSRLRYSEYTAFQTAVATGQVSEFAFILLGLGAGKGLIESSIVSLGGLVGVLTIAISSYLVIYSEPIYETIQKWGLLKPFKARQTREDETIRNREGHIIVVGMNALGREIVRRLITRREKVLAIDTDPQKLKGLHPAETTIGNVEYESMVGEIGLHRARLVVSALQIEDTNHLLAYRCRLAGVPCAIHAFDVSVIDDLLELGTNYMLTPVADAARKQFSAFDEATTSKQEERSL